MDITGLGDSVAERLVSIGLVRSFADLYALDVPAIARALARPEKPATDSPVTPKAKSAKPKSDVAAIMQALKWVNKPERVDGKIRRVWRQRGGGAL